VFIEPFSIDLVYTAVISAEKIDFRRKIKETKGTLSIRAKSTQGKTLRSQKRDLLET